MLFSDVDSGLNAFKLLRRADLLIYMYATNDINTKAPIVMPVIAPSSNMLWFSSITLVYIDDGAIDDDTVVGINDDTVVGINDDTVVGIDDGTVVGIDDGEDEGKL